MMALSSSQFVATKSSTSENIPFTTKELDSAIRSLQNVAIANAPTEWSAIRELFEESAHLAHKDWPRTEKAAKRLANLISDPDDKNFQSIFERVLKDGNWDGAIAATTKSSSTTKPWVVLVTGLNGIRKTTSTYQTWFKQALKLALASSHEGETSDLPSGEDSFFRQLDYMLCTVANEEFKSLYGLGLETDTYSSSKNAIFSRYRTIAEMVGVLLCKESIAKGINVMVETSGRDIAMFEYIDHFFPDSGYRKLVVHFTINDISFAERSVDTRMQGEMARGTTAVSKDATVRDVINCNAGGPYGSAVLKGVQEDSDKVWELINSDSDVAAKYKHWHKASLKVNAVDEQKGDWSVVAMQDGHPCSEPFPFSRLQDH